MNKFKKTLNTLLFSAITSLSQAQLCPVWEKTYGDNSLEYASVVKKDGDSFLLCGERRPGFYSFTDIYLVKTDDQGNTQWERTIGGDKGNFVRDLMIISDAYLFVGGKQSSADTDYDVYFFKLDKNGNTQWEKTYGGTGSDLGSSLLEIDDGYLISGQTSSVGIGGDGYIIKTDFDGNKIWEKNIGGNSNDSFDNSILLSDGYLFGGESMSYGHGYRPFWLVKTDFVGEKLWQSVIGSLDRQTMNVLKQTIDSFLLVGETYKVPISNYNDAYIVKTNNQGRKLWEKAYGGTDTAEVAHSLEETVAGYIVAGSTESIGTGMQDAWLWEIDPQGNLIWQQTFGGSRNDSFSTVIPVSGGYVLGGTTASKGEINGDLWLMKLSCPNGVKEWKEYE